MRKIPIPGWRAGALILVLGLAACSQPEESASTAPSVSSTPEVATNQPTAPAESAAPDPDSSSSTSTVAADACLRAVAESAGETNVSILSAEFSEANNLVMVGVGASQDPWRCLVSNDGQVDEVSYAGTQNASEPDQSAMSEAGSDVSDAAINACLQSVEGETGEGDLAVVSTEFSEANSIVMIGVGAARAPWRCLVSNDGQVAEVSFEGSEGAL